MMDFLVASLVSGSLLYLFDPNNPLLETYQSPYIPSLATTKSKSNSVYQHVTVKRNMNDVITSCPYCACCMTQANITREHLVPRSMGGRSVIFACRRCNNERGRSLTYEPFLNYIEKHPFVFLEHIRKSKCKKEMKERLRCMVDPHIVHEYDLKKTNHSDKSKRSPEEDDELAENILAEGMRSLELERQREARVLARIGRPLPGGRAARAAHQALRRDEKRRSRRAFRVSLRKVCDEYNYMDSLNNLFF